MDDETNIEINKIIYLMYSEKDNDILLKIDSNMIPSTVLDKDCLLYYAVDARRVNIVKVLLSKMYNPNAYIHSYNYAIHNISKSDNMFITLMYIDIDDTNLEKLIKTYADVAKELKLSNSVNKAIIREVLMGNKFLSVEDLKSLEQKSHQEELDIAKMLLDNGADVNCKENLRNCTPIHYAAYNGNIDMVNLLIAYGADVKVKSSNGYSVFYYSIGSRNITLMNMMLKYYDFSKDCECLSLVIQNNDLDILLTLLKMGLDVNSLGFNNNTPLHEASKSTSTEIVETLILHGAKINAKCTHLRTPLHTFTTSSHYSMVKLLLDGRADIHAKDFRGRTPLHNAVINYRDSAVYIVKALLYLGVDVNATDNEGNTPLHRVCDYERQYCQVIANILIDNGANVKVMNIDGNTPLHFIKQSSELVRILLRSGANPNVINKFGRTPLEPIIYNNVVPVIYMIPYIIAAYHNDKLHTNKKEGVYKNMKILEKYSLLKLISKCEKELEVIRSIKITNNYSLDVFINNNMDYNIVWLSNNPNINIDISSFYIYGDILKDNISKSRNRLKLLQNSTTILNALLDKTIWMSIPLEIKYYILSFLSDKELSLYNIKEDDSWLSKFVRYVTEFFTSNSVQT